MLIQLYIVLISVLFVPQRFEQLVQQFASLNLQMREIPTDSELTEKMEELNKMFAELVEDWQLMPSEAQQEY